MTNLELARHLAAEGFSVLPLCKDGKRPMRKWKRLQTTKPSDKEIYVWFELNDYAPGIVTGAVSGITVIDCDNDAAYVACREAGIDSPLTQTTKRGRHLVFRYSGERNTVRVNGIAKCDRRGEGGYIRAYPESAEWTRAAVDAAGDAPEAARGHTTIAAPPAQRTSSREAVAEYEGDAELAALYRNFGLWFGIDELVTA